MKGVCALLMLKNEVDHIEPTLRSLKNQVKSIAILDTGSTDGTQDKCIDICNDMNIGCTIKQTEFIAFDKTRNEELDLGESIEGIDWLLLLDAGDIFEGDIQVLTEFIEKNKDIVGLHLNQRWMIPPLQSYYNIRFIKKGEGFRFKEPIHEYIEHPSITKFPKVDGVVLYQDRRKEPVIDGLTASERRWKRDEDILKKAEKTPRNIFYYAQTLACCGKYKESLKWYRKRIETKEEGFKEEVYESYLRAGNLCCQIGQSTEADDLYMNAYSHFFRAEPLIRLAEKYLQTNPFLAFHYAISACCVPYPEYSSLFVDKNLYDYWRWHILTRLVSRVKDKDGICDLLTTIALKKCKKKNSKVDKANDRLWKLFYGKSSNT